MKETRIKMSERDSLWLDYCNKLYERELTTEEEDFIYDILGYKYVSHKYEHVCNYEADTFHYRKYDDGNYVICYDEED